ncbi:hypothetical protein OIN76_19845 [Acinetobacter baumannii]|nr:hypothetical protein [Acinetobacter baumannii]MCW1649732.1 hypothetical protein [Acinetobacter baumannii]
MMKLTNLLEEFHGTQAEYLDIVNYEIARENICRNHRKNADGKQNRGFNLLSG